MKSSSFLKRGRSFRLPFRTRSVQKLFVFITLITLCLLLVVIYEEKWLQQLTTGLIGYEGISGNWNKKGFNHNKNYFLNAARMKEMNLVVNTSHCKITDFNPFDEEVIPFIKAAEPLQDCLKTTYNWSRMDHDVLIMNAKVMDDDGYPFKDESCCYQIVTRESGPDLVDKKQADNTISYSKCIPITAERTKIEAEFIVVECGWSRLTMAHYRGFHSIATTQRNARKKTIQEKVDFWRNKRSSKENEEDLLPPNFLVVGIDSTSRINFRRNMFKTTEVLQSLGAIEMFGYTKVGENTWPSFSVLFFGYSDEKICRICLPNSSLIPLDNCPSIWKQLDEAKYLTAHTEDAPDFTGFNYRKAGFAKQPVDFYVRPMFLSALDFTNPFSMYLMRGEHIDCVGHQTNDEAITTYLESTMDYAYNNKAPIFSFSWSTTLSHDNFNMIQLADETYSVFLQKMITKGYLNNTILFFMGDHGYRFGPVRETLIGFYEDKLPNMWIRLPPKLQEKYPDWQNSLKINSRRLTSPYHYYWAINHIIKTFSPLVTPPQPVKDLSTGELIERKYVQNFFEPVPETNSCSDIGIPERYCACYPVLSLPLSDPKLLDGAKKAVIKVNSDLNPGDDESKSICAKLAVSKITAGAMMEKSGVLRYIVGFIVTPGEFLLEAEIDYFVVNKTFSDLPNVQRASKIDQSHVKCVTDPKVELFCYCKSA